MPKTKSLSLQVKCHGFFLTARQLRGMVAVDPKVRLTSSSRRNSYPFIPSVTTSYVLNPSPSSNTMSMCPQFAAIVGT